MFYIINNCIAIHNLPRMKANLTNKMNGRTLRLRSSLTCILNSLPLDESSLSRIDLDILELKLSFSKGVL